MSEREDFEAWCDQQYGNQAYLHTSSTCGEWDAYQAGRAITAQALSGNGAASTEVEAPTDTQRLDWLERQHVEVRTPLRYGSRANFHACPDLEEDRSDLRTAIDAALRGKD